MVSASLMVIFLILEWLTVVLIAHEEEVPVWTQLAIAKDVTWAKAPIYPGSRAKSSVWVDERKAVMWMFGGLASNTGSTGCFAEKDCSDDVFLDELWQYSIPLNQWRLIRYGNSSIHPTALHGGVACGKSGTFMVLFGGYVSHNKTLSNTWIFDVTNNIWHLKRYSGYGNCGEQPEGRAEMLYWCTAGSMWILGGVGSKGNILNDMWRFNFSNHCWTLQLTATNLLLKPKSNSTSNQVGPQPDSPTWVFKDTNLIFMSNVTSGGTDTTNQSCELWTMSTKNLNWRPFKLTSEARKSYVSHEKSFVKFKGESPACRTSSASWIDRNDNMWLFGGHKHIPRYRNKTSIYICDMWVLETLNGTWVQWLQKKYSKMHKYLFRTIPSHLNMPTPRAHTMSWSYNGTLFLFGGERMMEDGYIEYLNDLWSLNLGHPIEPTPELLLPPTGVFFVTLGALCFIAMCVFATIFVAKASSPQAPRLKPPSPNGKIKYSPVSTTEDVLFETISTS